MRVLIVEDEAAIADTLVFALNCDGFQTHWLQRAGPALAYLRDHPVDLVLLDVGLPDTTGFEACKELRRFSSVPVIFLTARGGEIDRVVGLEIGADDYVVKPFSPREVVARIRAVLKRTRQPAAAAPPGRATGSALVVDSAGMVVRYRGVEVPVTPSEFRLLQALLLAPGRVLSRDELLRSLGTARDAGYERSVDTHVKSLRAKLRAVAPDAEPIQTQRGFGYRYDPDAV